MGRSDAPQMTPGQVPLTPRDLQGIAGAEEEKINRNKCNSFYQQN